MKVFVYDHVPVSIRLDRDAYLRTDPGVVLEADPTGGSFSGPGVSNGVFYPEVAGPENSPHRIVYTYLSDDGCVSYDRKDLYVLYGEGEVQLLSGGDVVHTLCDDGNTYEIQGSNLDNIPGLFELRKSGSTLPVSGHITDQDTGDDKALLDPAGLAGSYDLIYTYAFRGLEVTFSVSFVVMEPGVTGILNLPDQVCKDDDPYLLLPDVTEGDPGATFSFSGPGVSGNQETGYYYDPGDPDAPVGENKITLEYNSSNGCTYRLTYKVINGFIPEVLFSYDPQCISPDGGLVTFRNLTPDKAMVDSWNWDFGDAASGENNHSNLENPEHFYGEAGSRTIQLTAISGGCEAGYTMDTFLYDRPVADFVWINDCFVEDQMTAFVDRSTSLFSPLDTLIWTFETGGGVELGVLGSSSSEDTVKFLFESLNHYMIRLQVSNEIGCKGEITKEINLSSTREIPKEGYLEDFDGAKTDWVAISEGHNLSWIRDVPDFDGFNQIPGDLAWYTDLPAEPQGYLEHSWVQSPCFDFRNMGSLVIKLNLMKSLTPDNDGAVLQYQDIASEGWKTLGKVGEGTNWYNVPWLMNKPGESNFGWGLMEFEPDQTWVNASHSLTLSGQESLVKFRVAVATGGGHEIIPGYFNQGFAFDDFFIGEQRRRVLLEHFTNSSDMDCRETDDIIDQLALNYPENVIDLQYHMNFPGVDIMNLNNPYPPSARAFSYGVQDVPVAILNGGFEPELRFLFKDTADVPEAELIRQQTAKIPQFDLDLEVQWQEESMEATALVTCKSDTFNTYLQLYVAVIETLVTGYQGLNQDTVFRNVVLDMLPTAAGKLLGNSWYKGKRESRSFSWEYVDYVEDIADLAVVAFVQDRDLGEILQVAINYQTPGVGIITGVGEERLFTVYPNPATDRVYVNLVPSANNNGQLCIMNLSGEVVQRMDLLPGSGRYEMDVEHLTGGLYIIYWLDGNVVSGRKKLVLTR